MSDASIIVADVAQTLTHERWVFTQFPTTLSDVRWVAPSPKTPNQILVRTASKLALIDINTGLTLASRDFVGSVVKLSKFNEPHVVMRDGSRLLVAYVENSDIKMKTIYASSSPWTVHSVMSSNLDLDRDTWTLVDTTKSISSTFNDLDESRSERGYKRYRFSDLLALDSKAVPANTQVEVGDRFIFALWPSELGLAMRIDLDSEQTIRAEAFNLDYIPAN